jgi:ABC-type branched-subunit amino acid transport system ATPase component
MTLLEARGISVAYGGLVALAGVDLAIEEHQVIALLGPNGSGKTTLFDVLCGLRRPAAGDVWLRGECVTGLPPWQLARRGVGRTFQIPAPFGALSVRDNVLVGVTFQARRSRTRAARLREVERLLTIVGLTGRASDAAATLSLGERKRLELALSLSGRPALLLLDELASGLSPKGREEVVRFYGRLRADDLTIVAVEHSFAVLAEVADRVLVLDRGRLVADGPPAVVLDSPTLRTAYLGEEE